MAFEETREQQQMYNYFSSCIYIFLIIYMVLAELTLVCMCFIFHGMYIGMSLFVFPDNSILYSLCSVVGTMLVHQGLDGIAKYYNY